MKHGRSLRARIAATPGCPERGGVLTLIDSISDHTTKELYLSMIRQVRQEHQVEFQYRRDAPDKRRLFSMRITRTPGGEVEFVSTLWNEKIRRSVSCLESDQPRSDAFLRVCRGCQQGMARF